MISLRSKITQSVLSYFFLNPEKRHYVNELARMLSLDPKNLHTKLKDLEKESILKSEFIGKSLYFGLNKNFPFFEEYKKIFLKTIGLEKKLADILNSVPGIQRAYIFGSYAKNKMDASSDIDVLVVGSHSIRDLQKSVNSFQRDLGREINLINMTNEEFTRKSRQKSGLLRNVLTGKHIKIA